MVANHNERRAHRRIETDVAAHLSCPAAQDAITIQTLNVSSSGLYCQVPRYMAPLTRLHVAMVLPLRDAEGVRSEFVEFDSVVARTEPEKEEPGREDYRVAIYFSGVTDKARLLIERYVRQRAKAGNRAAGGTA